ncbi:hypothetical protein HY632_01655 [Candidatus Uhrbacteria bacterium]|nr:hypothetical protein [Candidatus Uhrbacteria bacterium]
MTAPPDPDSYRPTPYRAIKTLSTVFVLILLVGSMCEVALRCFSVAKTCSHPQSTGLIATGVLNIVTGIAAATWILFRRRTPHTPNE